MENELEMHRIKLELMRVSTGKAEMMFGIMQRKAEMARLEANILIQTAKEEELAAKIAELNGKIVG